MCKNVKNDQLGRAGIGRKSELHGRATRALERVGQVHNFTKGMGLAAPQIHIGRCAAVVRTVDGPSPGPT